MGSPRARSCRAPRRASIFSLVCLGFALGSACTEDDPQACVIVDAPAPAPDAGGSPVVSFPPVQPPRPLTPETGEPPRIYPLPEPNRESDASACAAAGVWSDEPGSIWRVTRSIGKRQGDWVLTWDGDLHALDARQGLAVNDHGEIFLGSNGHDGASPRITAFVRKLGPDGEVLWTRRWSSGRGFFGEEVFAVVTLPDGGAVVGGQYQRDELSCQSPNSALGCTDAFLTRFDAAGGERWTLMFGNVENFDRVMGLARGDDGTLYASGQVTGTIKFADGKLLRSHGSVDHFLLALQPDTCEVAWAHSFGDASNNGEGPAVVALADGVAVGPVAGPGEHVRSYGRDGIERFAVSPVPASRGVLAADREAGVWVSGVNTMQPNQGSAELVKLDGVGVTRGRYTLTSPIGGLYALPCLVQLPDGRTLVAGTYGQNANFNATQEMVHQLVELSAAGPRTLDQVPLWSNPGGCAVSHDGALLLAGVFGKESSFGLGGEPLRAGEAYKLFLWHRSL